MIETARRTGSRTDLRVWRSIGRTRTASPVPHGWAPAVVLVLVSLVDRMEYSLVSAVLP
ncbi:hypothetical protein [Rhodococcoides kroppenstedtii]|uniref:hypothetical protein n=1 Tax=Rhodococcoides kroppenstedtii TaxID=293050 RepID=UPI001BDDEB5B|nr:hypothetical protein [Rhodococcus kroppenstedtii]MBT1190931.1 hypothetical protein [Rhodococcus kroppenstedtii]